MKKWLLAVVWLLVAISGSDCEPGFILTAPNILVAGSSAIIGLNFVNTSSEGTVSLTLLKSSETLSSIERRIINDEAQFFELPVPFQSPSSATLEVSGKFGSYTFKKSKNLEIKNPIVIIIQSDKYIYKPGQTVKFRILAVNNNLHPVDPVYNGKAWVENPSRQRVAQWSSVSFRRGIVQLETKLSDEPFFGLWKIVCTIEGQTESLLFEVKKYILPKFSVEITPPPYVFHENTNATWKVCAKYTYGKPVEGLLKITLGYQTYSWDSELRKNELPLLESEQEIFGCYNYTASGEEMMFHSNRFTRRKLNFTATVIENGTGIKQNSSHMMYFSSSRLELEFKKMSDNFKPGFQERGVLKVMKPDGTAAPNENIQLCFKSFDESDNVIAGGCRHFISSFDGLINFKVPAQSVETSRIDLKAKADDYHTEEFLDGLPKLRMPRTSKTLNVWFSHSHNYVYILPKDVPLKCGDKEYINVHYTGQQQKKFYYQVLVRGKVILQGSLFPNFLKAVNKEDGTLIPNRRDKLNLPDIGEFTIELIPSSSFQNKFTFLVYYISKGNKIVADSKEFSVETCHLHEVKLDFIEKQVYPGSEVNVKLTGVLNSICGIKVVDRSVQLMSPDNFLNWHKINSMIDRFEKKFEITSCSDHFLFYYDPGMKNKLDSRYAFQEASVAVLTDLDFDISPCLMNSLSRHFDSMDYLVSGSAGASNIWSLESRAKDNLREEVDLPESVIDMRNYFPETWLFDLHVLDENETVFTREIPHTITEWVGNALCLSRSYGLGISDLATVKAYQPFFMSFNLPYSVIRGESVPLIVSTFNYLEKCLSIKLSLSDSPDFSLLSRSVEKVCVCGGKAVITRFQIRPKTLGFINVTIHGQSTGDTTVCTEEVEIQNARDAVTRQLLVEAEGFPKEETKSKYICLNEQDNSGLATETFSVAPPEGIIRDSERAFYSLTGNVMSPAIDGIEKLVRLPSGCGEQNMVLLAPNIFVLDYLTASGQLTAELEDRLLSNMKTGYQRELNYQHPNGGFSAFGAGVDELPSLWLTTFVVKSFGKARKYIEIDQEVINTNSRWILEQQLENGCFRSVGKLFSSKMKGGLHGDSESLVPLTAYVLIALLEGGLDAEKAAKNTVFCIKSEPKLDAYALSLVSYGLALLDHPLASSYIEQLESKATIEGKTMHWRSSVNSLPVSIETAGYAVLALLRKYGQGAISKVNPVVHWITEQRRGNGGFVSTQDTVVALQALAEYDKYTNGEQKNIFVSVAANGIQWNHTVNRSNELLLQESKISDLPATLEVEFSGQGCVLFQTILKYNVPAQSSSVDLELHTQGKNEDCMPEVITCIKNKLSKDSMTVLEMKMISGFTPNKEDLEELQKSNSISLKRQEVIDDQVNLYFTDFSDDMVCFRFRVLKDLDIEDTFPATVSLYDYYEPDNIAVTNYTIPSCEPKDSNVISTSKRDTYSTYYNPVLYEIPYLNGFSQNVHGTLGPALSRFDNFRNVEHDLEFPDGIEGNVPVTVPAPPGIKEALGLLTCPSCYSSFPTNISHVFCSSKYVVRAMVQANNSMKLTHDLSPTLKTKVPLNKLMSYEMSENCSCESMQKGNFYVFLFGNDDSLLGNKPKLILNHNVILVKAESYVSFPDKLKRAQDRCPAASH